MRFKKSGKGSVLSGLKLTTEKIGKITLKTSSRSTDGISFSKSSGAYGSLQVAEIAENNYVLLKISVRSKKAFLLNVSSTKPILAMVFNLSDEVSGIFNGEQEAHTVFQYEHGLFFLPSLKGQLSFAGKKSYDLVVVAIEADYLVRYKLNTLLPEFFEKVNSGEAVQLFSPRLFSSEIAELILNFFVTKKQFAPSMYREAKVLELLHFVTEDITSCLVLHDPMSFADRLNLQKLRRFLVKNLSKKIALLGLAAKFNLPARLVDKKFKALNGTSISEFVELERMRKAYLLVTNTKLPLKRIAAMVGYESVTSFSWDFKKRFGEIPSGVRLFIR